MKLIILDNKNRARFNYIIDWLIYMVGYSLILILTTMIFRRIKIDMNYFGLYAFLAAIIIYILNKTIKPVLFILTLPITGLTMGLFYPFLNVIILKMADLILGKHFETEGIWGLFFIAILISIMNIILEMFVLQPITKRRSIK